MKMDFDAPELGLGPQLGVTGEGSTAYILGCSPKKWINGWGLGR